MNEQIQNLKDKIWTEEYWTNPNTDRLLPAQLNRFAELIVRECLSIVDSNNPRPPGTTIMYSLAKDEYFDTGWQVAVETKSNQIKQHFGVEE